MIDNGALPIFDLEVRNPCIIEFNRIVSGQSRLTSAFLAFPQREPRSRATQAQRLKSQRFEILRIHSTSWGSLNRDFKVV
jgi:hypothetical protein